VALLRSPLFLLLLGLGIVCWGLSLRLAGAHLHGAGLWPLFAMWSAMMVGMMVPVEAPSLLRLAPSLASAAAFLTGYFAPWMLFSLAAATLQSRMHPTSGLAAPMLLIAAGMLQLSPLKRACLERCRTEANFLSGVRASALCILSCGLLMLIPLVTGMSLISMALLTLLCLLERVAPRQWAVSRVSGVALAGWGAWML
jgi:predicted metal-binding membrane protein